MSINVELRSNNKKVKDFPKIMRYNSDFEPFVVLFQKEKIGTVLQSNCDDWEIGEISNDFKMANFLDYEGDVILSNN